MFIKSIVACGVVVAGSMFAMPWFNNAQASGLIYERDFETGSMDGWRAVGSPLRPMPVLSTQITRGGKYSAKAFLDSSAPIATNRERVEMRIAGASRIDHDTIGGEYWYGWSMYLKSPYPIDPIHWELLTQFHCHPDKWDATANPTLSFNIKPGTARFTIGNRSNATLVTLSKEEVSSRNWDGGAVVTDKWIDWVVNVKWSYESDGFLRIWRDGKLIVDYKGPNTPNDVLGPYFKMGIYKANWVTQAPHPNVKTRTVYYDEFKRAGSNGTYATVAPGGKLAPTAPSLVSVK